MKKSILIITFFLLQSFDLYSVDKLYYYEEALKAEKISPYLSIPLYEAFLKQNPSKQFYQPVVARLFDLYLQNNKIEELIFHINEYPLDKLRKKKANQFMAKIAKNIGLEEGKFTTMISLILGSDKESREKLIEFYQKERSVEILNYTFALKIKMGDIDSLGYIVSEISDMNPSFKIIYMIKTFTGDIEKAIENASTISELSDNQKMEILYLYGMYLRKDRKYKQSARFFLMSSSYWEDKKDYLPIGTMEAAKSLFLAGKRLEACSLIKQSKILIQNESDEFLNIYCSPKGKDLLTKLKPSLQLLSKKEEGIIFKKFLNKKTKKDKGKENEN